MEQPTGTETPTLEAQMERTAEQYQREGTRQYEVTYKAPSLQTPTRVTQTLESTQKSERSLEKATAQFQEINRKIMRTQGLEHLPLLARPIEVIRRYASSAQSGGEGDHEIIDEIGDSYVSSLTEVRRELDHSIESYDEAKGEVETYLCGLEDQLVTSSSKRDEIDAKLEILEGAHKRYLTREPTEDAPISERVSYGRGKRAMEKDLHALKSLRLIVSSDITQALDLITYTHQAADVLEVSQTMSTIASNLTGGLVGQLNLNMNVYHVTARSAEGAIKLGVYLDGASRMSDLLSQGTRIRTTSLGDMIARYSSPNGQGVKSIAGGGAIAGLKNALEEMQRKQDEAIKQGLGRLY